MEERKSSKQFELRELERQENEPQRYELSVASSTDSVVRYGAREVLDCAPGAVELSRVTDGSCPLLYNHNTDQLIGRVVSAEATGDQLRAVIEFDEEDEFARKVKSQIDRKILRTVSIRYAIDSTEEVKSGNTSLDGIEGPAYIARHWTLYEVSVVTVPADHSVGFGRNINSEEREENMNEVNVREDEVVNKKDDVREDEVVNKKDDVNTEELRSQAMTAERERCSQIMDLCKRSGVSADEFISSGKTIDEVRTSILNEMLKKDEVKFEGSVNNVREQSCELDDMVDALAARCGVEGEISATAEQLRSASLLDMAKICLERDGDGTISRYSSSNDVMNALSRGYFNPTASFPSIVEKVMKKSYKQQYELAFGTFEKWTSRGSLSDFKATNNYWYSAAAGEFLPLGENAELVHDSWQDKQLPQRKLDTKGRLFTITRQALYNDDIGMIARMPGRYAISAKRTINKDCYDALLSEKNIYDKHPLFDNTHNNIVNIDVNAGENITIAHLQKMVNKLIFAVDLNEQPIYMRPKYLLCPEGLEHELNRILHPVQTMVHRTSVDNDGYVFQKYNPTWCNEIQVIPDVYLNRFIIEKAGKGDKFASLYLIGDGEGMEVDYLNGKTTPTFERYDNPEQLGLSWKIYLDYGVNVMDFRPFVKATTKIDLSKIE